MTLAMRSSGAGPDLVLLHGWGLSGEVFAPLVEALAATARCHVIDLPGHGESPSVADNTLDDWADALVARLDRPAIWLGWSLGGLVALAVARRHPGRVRGLVLTACTPCLKQSGDWPYGLAPDTIEMIRAGLASDFVATVAMFLRANIRGSAADRQSAARLIDALAERPPSDAGLHAGLALIQSTDLRAALSAIDCPACLIGGRLDRLAHPEAMRWMADRLPNARLTIYPRAAHAPFISEAARFVTDVAEFIPRCGST